MFNSIQTNNDLFLFPLINAYIHLLQMGTSTGLEEKINNLWEHSYRHWSFKPREFKIDETQYKK